MKRYLVISNKVVFLHPQTKQMKLTFEQLTDAGYDVLGLTESELENVFEYANDLMLEGKSLSEAIVLACNEFDIEMAYNNRVESASEEYRRDYERDNYSGNPFK